MEVEEAVTYIREILTLVNIPANTTVVKELQSIVPLRVYMQSIVRILKERRTDESIDISVTFDGVDEEKNISLLDDSSFVFHKLLTALLPSLTDELILEYHEVSNIFLNHQYTTYQLKVQLIDIERQLLTQHIDANLNTYGVTADFYHLRLTIFSDGLKNENRPFLNSDEEQLENILSEYLSKIIVKYIFKGEILQSDSYLKNLLSTSEHELVKRVVFRQSISQSLSYHLYSASELLLLLDDYEDIFTSDEVDELRQQINYIPTNIHLSEFKISNGSLTKKAEANKNIITVIQFSIPNQALDEEKTSLITKEQHQIDILPIASFFQDPIFRSMAAQKLGGIGWHQFCDLEPSHEGNYSHIVILITDLYAPHVTLSDTGSEEVDFSEETAELGRKFHPHKKFAIQLLRKNYNLISPHIDLQLQDINLNLFSNFIVQYVDNSNSNVVHRMVHGLTNPNSFSISAGKFIAQVNSRNLSSSLIDIRKLLSSTVIKSEKNLAEFVYRLFDIVVKNSIELNGHYADTWKNENTPKSEPEIQPTIFNLIRHIFKYMGVNISRESIVSSGEIDFLVTYTINNNDAISVAVELKLAHNSNIDSGINAQLPRYMEGLQCRYGVFIVLWFKNEVFKKPTKYTSVQELETHIKNIKSNHRIMEMVIDCTKPTSPSKLKIFPNTVKT